MDKKIVTLEVEYECDFSRNGSGIALFVRSPDGKKHYLQRTEGEKYMVDIDGKPVEVQGRWEPDEKTLPRRWVKYVEIENDSPVPAAQGF
jgi:hypothetical protein